MPIKNWMKKQGLLLMILLAAMGTVSGSVPEPATILYGTASIGDVALSRTSNWVTVEAKINGQSVASYVMGAESAAADQYVLRIPMDSEGVRNTGTARTGDIAYVYVDETLAHTLTLGERGTISQVFLNIEQSLNIRTCTSTQSGPLFDPDTFGGNGACLSPNSLFVIASGHTVTWDGSGDPLKGAITINSGGKLQVSGTGIDIPGTLVLNGGLLEVIGTLSVGHLEQSASSSIVMAEGASITSNGTFHIGSTETLEVFGDGTFIAGETLTIDGALDVAQGTLDLRGTHVVLGADLDTTGGTLLTDSSTHFTLSQDVTLSSDQLIHVGNLELNNHALALGSASSDLEIHNAFVLDHASEQILSNLADVTFDASVSMTAGAIRSTGGTINFTQGSTLTAGTLELNGSQLVSTGAMVVSGVTVITDISSQVTPLANAGNDQSVASNGTIALDGTASSDLDGTIVSYHWVQTSGSTVLIPNPDIPKPLLSAPIVTGEDQTLIFELTVTDDDGLSHSQAVVITVLAEPESPSGALGDMDGNGQINDADVAQLNLCLSHQQFVSDFEHTIASANAALNVNFASDCGRLIDLDGDGLVSGTDTLRLAQCVEHVDLINFSAKTEAEANTLLDITYATDCSLVNSLWP